MRKNKMTVNSPTVLIMPSLAPSQATSPRLQRGRAEKQAASTLNVTFQGSEIPAGHSSAQLISLDVCNKTRHLLDVSGFLCKFFSSLDPHKGTVPLRMGTPEASWLKAVRGPGRNHWFYVYIFSGWEWINSILKWCFQGNSWARCLFHILMTFFFLIRFLFSHVFRSSRLYYY